jgi:ABC-2 type transport system permease protein
MIDFFSDTYHLTIRHIRTTIRIPIWIAVMLVQPVIWLTLYGQLFRRVVEIPGFESDSYIQFLTPGVVIMTAFFGSAWSGMGILEDLQAGVIDRMLATPVSRAALIASRVVHAALTVSIQSVIILLLGLVLGASIPGGIGGMLAILLLGAPLGAGWSAISNGVALLTRREETLIAIINFFGMPLIFISTAFMASDLMPGWIRFLSNGNPVNWATDGARNAMAGEQWMEIWTYSLLLAAFVLVASFFSTQAFRMYQRAA